jgi:hypothetical protein
VASADNVDKFGVILKAIRTGKMMRDRRQPQAELKQQHT